MEFLDKILKLAETRGLDQAEVESLAGLPRGRITKWKSDQGEPSAKQALRLARTFGVKLEWLADDEASWPPTSSLALGDDERMIWEMINIVGYNEAKRRLMAVFPHEHQKSDVKQVLLESGQELAKRLSHSPFPMGPGGHFLIDKVLFARVREHAPSKQKSTSTTYTLREHANKNSEICLVAGKFSSLPMKYELLDQLHAVLPDPLKDFPFEVVDLIIVGESARATILTGNQEVAIANLDKNTEYMICYFKELNLD